jgi:DNA (cytosine-5)-methyltransferase 1
MALHTLEICSGVGMLGEGLRAGLQYMGVETRTVCHIEREAYAAAVLAARMEEGAMDPAPVWSDLLTFDAAAWRGAVDCIVAGFPCQDLSLAGKRAGLDGKRSGLFFDILDIADACGARYLFLENVAGIASATASVVDEAEGPLEERAASRVMGELADRGWDAEWITLSASDVGASHGRARWFCWAWRMGHPGLQHQHLQQRQDGAEHSGAVQSVAHTQRAERREKCVGGTGSQQGHDGRRPEAHGGPGVADAVLGHAASTRCEECGQCGQCELSAQAGSGLHHRPEFSGIQLADPTGHGRHQGRPEPGREQGRPDAAECGGAVADAECPCGGAQEPPANLGRDTQAQRPADQHSGCGSACVSLADTGRTGRKGSELGRTLHDNRGGGESTWTN